MHQHLGIEGSVAAYELVGPTWQLNVINVNVPFGEAADTFLEHLMETYQHLAMKGPTVIIGDFNAASTRDDCWGGPASEDTALKMAMQHVDHTGPHSLPTGPILTPTPETRLDRLINRLVLRVEVTQRRHQDMPSKTTGHRPLEVQLKVLQIPPAPWDDADQDEQPTISPSDEQDTPQSMAYYRMGDRLLAHQADRNLKPCNAAYLHNPTPYKSLKHVANFLGETGHQETRAVRLQEGMVTKNPKMVIEEVLSSFMRQHNAEEGELSDYAKNLI